MTSFYPSVKDGLSPSALAQWINSRSAFVKSYFAMERGPETKAMQTGTEIHALIEAGIIPAKHVYEHNEGDVSVQLAEGRIFRGRPDSYEAKPGQLFASFVDYKSGKANAWVEKLPTDIKMRATAFLVWKECHQPEEVRGHIEYFQTTWDPEQRKVVLVEGTESEVISIVYSEAEMKAFEQVVLKAMDDINEFYKKWIASTGDFVSKSDIESFVDLKREIDQKETELEEIAERIQTQMEFGGEENHKVPGVGSFFIKTTNTWEYPEELAFNKGWTLKMADEIAAAAKAAKSNFELINEPKTTKRKVQFRAAKEKN